MNDLINDLLTILTELHTQVERGSLSFEGISANNIAYIKEVVAAGANKTEEEDICVH